MITFEKQDKEIVCCMCDPSHLLSEEALQTTPVSFHPVRPVCVYIVLKTTNDTGRLISLLAAYFAVVMERTLCQISFVLHL